MSRFPDSRSRFACADGFSGTVRAGDGCACTERPADVDDAETVWRLALKALDDGPVGRVPEPAPRLVLPTRP
jgi:hypothetical protein